MWITWACGSLGPCCLNLGLWITCAPRPFCLLFILCEVMQNENLGSKKAKAQTRIRPKSLGPKKRNDCKKKNIKGCITENKKAEAQIRTRLKRLWPKKIVDFKKNSSEKGSIPENKRPNYWARPMQISKIKRKKIKWAELLGLAHQDG